MSEKERSKIDTQVFGSAVGKWGRRQEEQMWGEDGEFGLDISDLRCV